MTFFTAATAKAAVQRLSYSNASAAVAASSSSTIFKRTFASVGDSLPSVELHLGFPPKKYNLADFAKNKSILVVGLPGAFTCDSKTVNHIFKNTR
mmetsp:Transcript_48939/g.118498  ORF Transcript_48939/g.118498 Transcript_48939/m.118498 type:complete len:95 (+) Transcript_48939:564-848(+)